VPIDLDADEVDRAIIWTLGAWEPPVREALGLDPAPERVHPDRLCKRAAGLLSANVRAFCALGPTWGYPDGLEGGCVAKSGLYGVLSAQRLHRWALRVLGLADPAPPRTATWAPLNADALVTTDG
jgi:hypothetical protein